MGGCEGPDATGASDARGGAIALGEAGREGGAAPGSGATALPPVPGVTRLLGPDAAPDPGSRGLDPALLDQAFREAASFPRIQSLLVARHGELVREAYWNGASPQRIANIKSASKTVLSTLVALALAEGHLESLDQPILDFLPEYREVNPDPRLARITVGHLLSMQAGLESTSGRNYGAWAGSRDWVRDALRRPFVADPGERMVYSTGSSHLLSVILTRATGESTLAFARRTLFGPLDISLGPWTRDPQGVYLGGNEMGLRPREMLAFGELHRRGGVTPEGRRLMEEAWIQDAWTQRGTSRFNGHGHGLGWWVREYAGYQVRFAWGHGGQYIFLVPELELTVVTTATPEGGRAGAPTRALHRLLEEVLIPAAVRGEAPEEGGPGARSARAHGGSLPAPSPGDA